MAALGSMVFEVLLKPARSEPMLVGEFSVDLHSESGDTSTPRVHVDKEMIAEGLRRLADRLGDGA